MSVVSKSVARCAALVCAATGATARPLSTSARLVLLARARSLATSSTSHAPAPSLTNTLNVLEKRSLLNDCTNQPALARLLESQPTVVYAGFDPTATSLHVGNLLTIIALLHFQLSGHQAIALIGGATGSIGDPSGKTSERQALDETTLKTNMDAVTGQLSLVFANAQAYAERRTTASGASAAADSLYMRDAADPVSPVAILNNADWFKSMTLLDFIGSVGRRARVSAMLARESVKNRLSSPEGISFTEFTYQLLQAFDFWHLFANQGCRVQLGGSDQWGNITAGTDLIKKSLNDGLVPTHAAAKYALAGVNSASADVAYGVTLPLVTTASGEKFGKSAGNAVWLSESLLSVFDFYQFFRRTPDTEVGRYLRYFTLLSESRIDQILEHHKVSPQDHLPQRTLAAEVTELVHGADKAAKAKTQSDVLFGADLSTMTASEIVAAFRGDKRLVSLPRSEVVGVAVCDVAASSQTTKSKSAARKLVGTGGLYLNNHRVKSITQAIEESDLVDGCLCSLRTGKNNYVLVSIE
ncbi:hypothetical protein BC831DRAFT_463317 [Entophlyctis helioformis]|nr:hypothetical protein BC831DRAFT_463317 [Entophlyctis helioformis]